jgi:hypothetical protein
MTKHLFTGAFAFALALGPEGGMDTKQHATGSFEVKVAPVAGADTGVASGRYTMEKTFAGDFVGTSRGDMWAAATAVKGSAGAVAIERIEGTLRGRRGGFTVIHQSTMRRDGDYRMRIIVVPDSGSGELEGIDGAMTIRIEKDGGHFYDLEYTLPPKP